MKVIALLAHVIQLDVFKYHEICVYLQYAPPWHLIPVCPQALGAVGLSKS